jgi:two-component system OmpR family response regulator
MRILVVEDDKVLADALSRALVQTAHAVDIVSTGEEADHALGLAIYDLAILDIGLPGLSGLEVLKRLRGRRSTMPVLMLTAFDTMEDQVRGLDLGADDYLSKPFDLPVLEARVRALLRRARNPRLSSSTGCCASTPWAAASSTTSARWSCRRASWPCWNCC